jgi:hypothetical protein
LRLALSKVPHRVGATPFPFFYLKTEAEPASETLFFKEKTFDDGYSPTARFFEKLPLLLGRRSRQLLTIVQNTVYSQAGRVFILEYYFA